MKLAQTNTNTRLVDCIKSSLDKSRILFLKYTLGFGFLFAMPLVNAAPGEPSTKLSSLCSVLAPSSFTVPDRIEGKEVGFRVSILENDKTTIEPIFKFDAFKKGDFSFVTYTDTLPTFPIIQPSSDNLPIGEKANTSSTAETRYVIGGGNSSNEVCVYKYQLYQIAGQFIRTGLSAVEVKFTKP